MATITILKGLPGSGKSTLAKEMVTTSGGEATRVNKDDLRNMMHGGIFSKDNEKIILKVRDYVITTALKAGRDVIVDDTNLHPDHERQVRLLAGAEHTVEVRFIDTPISECIRRDALRDERSQVGEKVIRRMAADWEKWKEVDCTVNPDEPQPYTVQQGLSFAIMCDLDGTLAHMAGRGPFDWKRCIEDTVDGPVLEVLNAMYELGYEIIYLSGRDAVCRPETEEWLDLNEAPKGQLFMRPEGDNRKDSIVKRELFDQNIRGRYNILFVLDDRDQVVQVWRQMGLKCLQCAPGDF